MCDVIGVSIGDPDNRLTASNDGQEFPNDRLEAPNGRLEASNGGLEAPNGGLEAPNDCIRTRYVSRE